MRSKKTRSLWIAECYPTSNMYNEEAGKTVGQAALSLEVIQNRRKVQGRLTPQGKDAVLKAMELLQPLFGPNVKLSAKFDRHCGCSMCPCSPGMKIMAEFSIEHRDTYYARSREESRMAIFLDDNDKEPIHSIRFRNYGMIANIQDVSVENDLLSKGDKSFYIDSNIFKQRRKAYEKLMQYAEKLNRKRNK
jgi:hypothetical protein